MGSTESFFFEDDSVAERVSRRLLGPAEPEGRPAKLTRFFRLLRARRAGHGARPRARESRLASPRSIPRRPRRAAPTPALRGRRENGPPVEKNTILLCYIIYGCGLSQLLMDSRAVCTMSSFLRNVSNSNKILGHVLMRTTMLVCRASTN